VRLPGPAPARAGKITVRGPRRKHADFPWRTRRPWPTMP